MPTLQPPGLGRSVRAGVRECAGPRGRRREIPMMLLRVVGCDSVQYTSIERSVVGRPERATQRGQRSMIAYISVPRGSEFVEVVRRAGGEVLSLELSGRPAWPRAAVVLAELMRRERPDVLHTNFTPLCHHAMAV